MDLLCIEREAVYRRLRMDVLFTVHEIVTIATAWHISIDELISLNSGAISFQMRNMNYINPSEDELNFLQKVIDGILYSKQFPNTEFMDICNKLPRQALARYRYLSKFYLFKWDYQYGNNNTVPYSKIILSNEMLKITKEYDDAIKLVPTSNFIFDLNLFNHLISDIQYFYSIGMITNDEKDLIKQDLFELLDYMHEIANKGCFPETKNKVNIYISNIYIDTNYNYVYTPDNNICFVHVFDKFEIYTYNSEIAINFRTWMRRKIRSSIQISEVDERSRLTYFTNQRKLIDSL
jgi:hypothetical protein